MQVDPVAYARWCSLSVSKARPYANWFAGKRNSGPAAVHWV